MPDFIDGIFNYCDRWCERCPLTARCRQFKLEALMTRRTDIQNAEFWKELDLKIQPNPKFEAMLAEAAEEVEQDEDWSTSLESTFDAEEDGYERAQNSPLSQAAFKYAHAVRAWVEKAGLKHRERPAGNPATLHRDDALDVIEWYSLQIGVKLTRAASNHFDLNDDDGDADYFEDEADAAPLCEYEDDEPWEDDMTQALREAGQSDRDGSAKVALIGIERSLGALTVLRRELPAEETGIRDLLQQLTGLRVALDRRFPGARTFIRPGFDDE